VPLTRADQWLRPEPLVSTRGLLVVGLVGAVAVGAVVAFVPEHGPEVVVVLIAGFAALLRARRLLLSLTTVAFLAGSSTLAIRDGAYYGRYALLGFLALTSALDWEGGPGLTRLERRFMAALLGLGLLFLGSTAWSQDPGTTAEGATGFVLLAIAVWSLARGPWRDRDKVRADVAAVAGTLAVFLGVGCMTWLAGSADAMLGDRVRGLLENPNTVAAAGAFLVPVALALAGQSRGPRRAAWAAAFSTGLVALVLSGSRGGVLAGALGVVLMTFQAPATRSWRTARAVVLATIVVLVFALSVSSQVGGDSLTERFRGTGDRDRRRAWEAAVEVWSRYPVAGVGHAAGDELVTLEVLYEGEAFRGGTAFNGYLQTLVDVGPLGVGLLAVCLFVCLRGAGRSRGHPLESALFGAVAAGALLQLVEAGLTSSGSVFAYLFWINATALVCLRHGPTRAPAAASGERAVTA
jgi:hypothetical protein